MTQIPLNTSVVSGVLLKACKDGFRMLLLKRAKEGFWCHVAGKIEGNEKAWQAFIREVKEETSIVVDDLYSADYLEQFYEADKNQISIIPVFVALVASDIEVVLNEEHTQYQWCTLDEAKSLVPFPNQRAVFDHVWKNFVDAKPSPFMKISR
ncbi:NUDIX domain-containing protein [Maricurvus nonylphenolicus]|uniref:NUDIX hydrolase n=1 Tax=Maricurvus nonylphenolicus TaxID=1008307 RepID=UPI0036F252F6